MPDEIGLGAREWRFRRGRDTVRHRGPRAFYGGESNSSSHSASRDFTPKEYKQQRGFIVNQLRSQIAGDVPGITGPFAASITPDEQAALSAFRANEFDPGGVGAAADAQLKATLGSTDENPYLKQAIDAATRPILQNAQLQELRDRANFTASGQKIQGSTAFQENRNNAIRDTEAQIAGVGAQLAWEERKNQLAAVTLANSRLADQREGISALALPRLIEQYGIDKGNEELQRRFQMMEQALMTLSGLTSPTLGNISTSWSQSTQGGAMGGGGGGGAKTPGGGGGLAGLPGINI